MAVTSSTAAHAAEKTKPNVVYIMADDLGYGDLSCYGQLKFETPNIDRLATEGIRFTQHYSGSTVCAPSRCSLMTGKHTGHTFVRGNQEVKPEGQWPLPEGTATLGVLFKQVGYTTGMFGKWGLGGPGSTGDPMRQGFDAFYGYNCQRHAHRYDVDYLWHDDEKVNVSPSDYSHDLISEQALTFIRDHKDEPFFCYMPITIPHAAVQVPEDDAAPFREKWPEFEDVVGKYAGVEVMNPIARFAGMVTRMDRTVGQVLDLLEELGLDDNTLVIFTSDNGPHQEGGHDPVFFDSNGPLRGIKRDLYEGGIRVPMVARWPNAIKPGTTSDHISAFWDVLPTLGAATGFDVPDGVDGLSFLPALVGDPDAQVEHEFLYWEFHERGGKQAIRKGDWKAVRLNVRKNRDSPIELYDLSDDLLEEKNVADTHPEIVKEMDRLMREARTESTDFKLFN
jgi:arylsulfatase A-like enzyme